MTTLMATEARDSAQRIAEQLSHNATLATMLGERIRKLKPHLVMMVGRGSSDHAGVYAKYLIEIETGVPVCASAPSVTSVYGRTLQLDGALVLVISQSGRSPDILAQAETAKKAGAFVVALVNDEASPLAALADAVLPLKAGPELAVAATKSYLCTLSAVAQLVAAWTRNKTLLAALDKLPQALDKVCKGEPQLTLNHLQALRHCIVLGRGLGYGISREVALKLKEVCGIQAEAFSSAEFLHGPVTLASRPLSVIDLHIEDETALNHRSQIEDVQSRGAKIIPLRLDAVEVHPRLAPLCLLQRFYLDIAEVAVQMGLNPDAPVGLNKVTRTL
ncbi:glucosamine-6-phosphate deaminase NagB-II [Gallaecimonas xiamenensis]|uniref:Glutamine--fructose-6-phosphate transaminase (Isomerizing) n=1 Tax=Gallaecimonas xiamenensis 3-C-1 TaxID=745411 RepID=K2JZH1_9GAMM|nr:SIS domain-containing protein [Gallaecimonas xiamenensis]EKE75724.1 glutamine--fructose-6-phosphate transaminase (isomerizing) [Gallaecimonas xiamenensis 3-C-1]